MRSVLAIAAALPLVHTLVSPDVLEPSVQNEVDHALAIAPSNAFERAGREAPGGASAAAFCEAATNGLDATAAAIRLVSLQRADGRWFEGTNDCTAAAVWLLRRLGCGEEEEAAK